MGEKLTDITFEEKKLGGNRLKKIKEEEKKQRKREWRGDQRDEEGKRTRKKGKGEAIFHANQTQQCRGLITSLVVHAEERIQALGK